MAQEPRPVKTSAVAYPYTSEAIQILFNTKLWEDNEPIIDKPKKFNPPNADGFEQISNAINKIEEWMQRIREPWSEAHNRAARISQALNTLTVDLPVLCGNLERGGPFGTESIITARVYESERVQLETLLAAVKIVGPAKNYMALVQIMNITDKVEEWKHYASPLVDIFTHAMLTTNTNFKPGLSITNPATRFIAAVAPRLSNEKPTYEAVLKHRKKRL